MNNLEEDSLENNIRKLIKVTKTIAEGHYFYYYPKEDSSDPEGLISQLALNFNTMISKLKEQQDDLEKKIDARTKEILKIKQSKERMNPHFLFNSLNMIHQLLSKDSKKADKALLLLADIYRYLMEFTENDLVALEDEWKFLIQYLELMKLRFSDSLSIKIIRPTILPDWKVPSLSIQPIIENCFKHGYRNQTKEMKIQITFTVSANVVEIVFEDNGQGFDSNEIGNRSLGNILERFQYYYENASLIIQNNEGLGTKVILMFCNFKYWKET
ncbi:MAG: histidine kinase [Leptospiraceae bacterium]|nr:histidine kinase [Leptospiraceae bacterium]